MQYLHSSNSDMPTSENNSNNILSNSITWTARILLGIVFMFSGFTKSIDPWGTIYKIHDYLAVSGISLFDNLTIVTTFLLCSVEFLAGFFVFTGSFRRFSAWLILCIMCIMLPLTAWIAIANPVSDCGCFGDAWVLSNHVTFFKNLILTIAAIWLVKHAHSTPSLITPALQWISFMGAGIFIGAIALTGYVYQPLIDFRPDLLESRLIASDNEAEDETSFLYTYRKGDSTAIFSEYDALPCEEDGWQFVSRETIENNIVYDANKNKHLRIWDKNGDYDVTDEIILDDKAQIILFIPSLPDVSIASTWQINSMYTWAQRHNINMLAIVSGNSKDIEEWEDLSMPSYPIYTSEDTSIKEVVRGNPAVVYLENGIIKWKSTLRALNADDFLNEEIANSSPMAFAYNNDTILFSLCMGFLSITGICIIFSFIPTLAGKLIQIKKIFSTAKKK